MQGCDDPVCLDSATLLTMFEWRWSSLPGLALALVTLAVILPSGESIICYQCKSWTDPGCENIKQNDTRNPYAKFCDDEEIPVGVGVFCRTIRQSIKDGNGTERLWRKCGWEEFKSKTGRACYHYADGHHEETVCQCFFDYCNAAPSWRVSPLAVSAAVGVAVVAALRGSRGCS